MFQWSSNNVVSSSTTATSSGPTSNRMRYPGQRTTVTAQSIQGSIRAPSEYTYAQHLDSYLQDEALKPSTRVVRPGNETFDTVFKSVNGATYILRVHFGESNYPQMSLVGMEAAHHWIDAQGLIVGYRPIQSVTAWRDSRLLLGQAVHQVVQELQTNPPVIHRITDPALERIHLRHSTTPSTTTQHVPQNDPPPPTYSSMINSCSSSRSTSPMVIDLPEIPTQFPELEALDRERLDQLLTSPIEFQAFCHKLECVKSMTQMTTSMVDTNAQTARQNLQKEEQLKELYERAKCLQDELRKKVDQFRILEEQQDKLCNPVDMRKVIKDLTKAKKEAFDQSEQLAEYWIEDQNGADVDEFLSKFLDIRKLHHVRAAKLELLEARR